MADDDRQDQRIVQRALEEANVARSIEFVGDGQELLELLEMREGDGNVKWQRPSLILLDLNMPRMDGGEALKLLKADERFREIPVVVLTTSNSRQDVIRSYRLGANSFITKPMTYAGFVDAMKALNKFWFETSQLPTC